jgi:hypothetical protein
MKGINLSRTNARKIALRAKGKQPTLLKEIPHYLKILATARKHGIRFSTPSEAYHKMGVSMETATQFEIMRMSTGKVGKLTQKQIIELAKDNVKQAYRAQIPNPTATKLK